MLKPASMGFLENPMTLAIGDYGRGATSEVVVVGEISEGSGCIDGGGP